jgi:hypothetical protein
MKLTTKQRFIYISQRGSKNIPRSASGWRHPCAPLLGQLCPGTDKRTVETKKSRVADAIKGTVRPA